MPAQICLYKTCNQVWAFVYRGGLDAFVCVYEVVSALNYYIVEHSDGKLIRMVTLFFAALPRVMLRPRPVVV